MSLRDLQMHIVAVLAIRFRSHWWVLLVMLWGRSYILYALILSSSVKVYFLCFHPNYVNIIIFLESVVWWLQFRKLCFKKFSKENFTPTFFSFWDLNCTYIAFSMVWQHSFVHCPLSLYSLPVETTDWTINVSFQFSSVVFYTNVIEMFLTDVTSLLFFLPFSCFTNIFVSVVLEVTEDNLCIIMSFSSWVPGPIALYLWHFLADCWTLSIKNCKPSQPHSLTNLSLRTSAHICWWGSQFLDSLLSLSNLESSPGYFLSLWLL